MNDKTATPDEASSAPVAEPRMFESRHTGTFRNGLVAYRCIASETHIEDKEGLPRASIFSFSYFANDNEAIGRPVTFVFNGGPGSASLWLHMGAIGPRIIKVPSDAKPAGSGPYTVTSNPLCNLDLTDLVFIDPPGTGYSRMIGKAKQEDAWGLDVDAELIAEFIKTWLTRHQRWGSPRFLCGESYGTTRAVSVAGKLHGGLSGVAFNGIALISTILDFHTARFEKGNVAPDVCFLPTYAMTALFHGKISPIPPNRTSFLDDVRDFATLEYLPALFAGSRLDDETRRRVIDKLRVFHRPFTRMAGTHAIAHRPRPLPQGAFA